MKLTKDEFCELQKHWYDKLAETGFKDIEYIDKDGEYRLNDYAVREYVFRSTNEFERRQREEYYRWMAHESKDESTVYRNEVDKFILIRHSEGARINTIVSELKQNGMSRNRWSVRVIIRKYEMEWGIKHYDRKQLRRYK